MKVSLAAHGLGQLLSSCTALIVLSNLAVACELPTTITHTATAVIDSRTLKLDDGTELRLAAILGPTSYDSPAAPQRWPPETVAIQALSKRIENRNLSVSLERKERDRYGRRIGHAILTKSTAASAVIPFAERWLQAITVRAGHARVVLSPEIDRPCAKHLLSIEATAEANQRGLWSNALYQAKRAEDTGSLFRYRSTYQMVEGVVARVAILKSAIYLNFGTNWKRDFTAKLTRATLRRTRLDINIVKLLRKKPVRIRGWIEKRNGPMITIWRPEQIELLKLKSNGETERHVPPVLLSDTRDQIKPGQ